MRFSSRNQTCSGGTLKTQFLGTKNFTIMAKLLPTSEKKESSVTNYNANVGLARELNEVVSLVLDPGKLYVRYDVSDVKKKMKKQY